MPNSEWLLADTDGMVAECALVAGALRLLDARATTERTLVVFDEVHHAGDDLTWGTAVVEAFADAEYRLSVSGTPFRSDNARIPHIRYERAPVDPGVQRSVPDYACGYAQALTDGVVRPVTFAAYSGGRWRGRTVRGRCGWRCWLVTVRVAGGGCRREGCPAGEAAQVAVPAARIGND